MTENDKQLYQLTQGVTRIANYMHEILLLVKKDQEETKKRWKYEPNEDGFMGSENRIESE
jgi:hypothetical protein